MIGRKSSLLVLIALLIDAACEEPFAGELPDTRWVRVGQTVQVL